MIDYKLKEIEDGDQTLLFELSGHLDADACDYLFSILEDRVHDGHARLVIDCEGLEFISSVGLGMLIRIHSRLKKRGGDVRLSGVHGPVADALRLVALDKVLKIYPSAEAAVESLKA